MPLVAQTRGAFGKNAPFRLEVATVKCQRAAWSSPSKYDLKRPATAWLPRTRLRHLFALFYERNITNYFRAK